MFTKIGPSARYRLRRCSPFASLLQDIALSLSPEEVANLKLAISVDRKDIVPRKHLCNLRFGAEFLDLLESKGIIENDNLEYLEYLFLKWGRKDLVRVIEKYHERRIGRDQTVPKMVSSSTTSNYTQVQIPLQPRNRNTPSPSASGKPTCQPNSYISKVSTQNPTVPRRIETAVKQPVPSLSCSSLFTSPRQGPSGSSYPDHTVPSTPKLADHVDGCFSFGSPQSGMNLIKDDQKLPTGAVDSATSSAPMPQSATFSPNILESLLFKKTADAGSPSSSQESQMSIDDQPLSQMSISDDEKTSKLHLDKLTNLSPMDVGFTCIKN